MLGKDEKLHCRKTFSTINNTMHRPALPTKLNSDEKENFFTCTSKVGTSITASFVKCKKVKISRAYKCGIKRNLGVKEYK